ncbi:MAG: VanW family protein [Actinobacteria bacterium]|nr:VanW family protein [Actinomycetota bacterium]
MPRAVRHLGVVLAVPLVLLALLALAWQLDTSRSEGRVQRRVTLAGRPVSGLTEQQLGRVVGRLAAEVPARQVEVRAPGGGFTTDGRTLGLRVAEPATVRAALRVGRSGSAPTRLWQWVNSFRGDRPAPLRVSLDASAVYATVAAKDPGPRRPPVEPSIAFKKGAFVAVAGEPGRGIDPADVIAALPSAANEGDRIVVKVERGEVAPRFPLAMAQRLAGEVQAKVTSPLPVQAGKAKATVPVSTQRAWVRSEAADDGLHPKVDAEAVLADLDKLLPGAGEPPVETRFTVTDGSVQIIAGAAGTKCCGETAVERVERVLFRAGTQTVPVELPLTVRPPKLTAEKAAALGIKEPVGTFMTKHKGGEPRVANIHRIADLVRGAVVEPGEAFSINQNVGKRTAEKGFVVAPVIEDGKLADDVGGGVSQFATTLFNAAFFAGLDFGEYQSHSLYISRYPYGREATMGYPHPDLVIKNTSPYGVLIWPSYNETSVTVTLYSTKFVDAQQTGQSEGRRGACKRVTTERTRTYLADGRREVDRVFATYRPKEGVNC